VCAEAYPSEVPEELERPAGRTPVVQRLLLGAVAVLVALTVVGWVVGAVLAALRTLVVIVAVVAIAVVLLRGVGRD
jgi:Flp pilus assembly protein TadB